MPTARRRLLFTLEEEILTDVQEKNPEHPKEIEVEAPRKKDLGFQDEELITTPSPNIPWLIK